MLNIKPENTYLKHLTVEKGTANALKEELVKFILKSDLLNDILAIRADRRVVNTGSTFKKPIQWIICQLPTLYS